MFDVFVIIWTIYSYPKIDHSRYLNLHPGE